jgi:hypothetical protein
LSYHHNYQDPFQAAFAGNPLPHQRLVNQPLLDEQEENHQMMFLQWLYDFDFLLPVQCQVTDHLLLLPRQKNVRQDRYSYHVDELQPFHVLVPMGQSTELDLAHRHAG